MEECVDHFDTMSDGIMSIGLDSARFLRLEVPELSVQEQAQAGLLPIGRTTKLINRRMLLIDTRMRAAGRTNPRKWGERIQHHNRNTNVNADVDPGALADMPHHLLDALHADM